MIDQQKNIGISVVIDHHPRFFCELVLWLLCAKESLSIPIRVYFANCKPAGLIEFVKSMDVDIRFVETLLPESPHCNKLIPFLDPAGFEHQIVSDSDLFFVGNIVQFFKYDQVRLPPNNHGLPPSAIFNEIFSAAGFKNPPEPGVSLFPALSNRETFTGNVCAALTFIPSLCKSFAHQWLDRARWLLTQQDILGKFVFHTDQISCAMAIEEHQIPFSHLPPQTNAVLQLLPQIQSVYGFHLSSAHIPKYPNYFRPDKTLDWQAIKPSLKEPIIALNDKILACFEVLETLPETKDFCSNFLNPKYDRNK